MTHKRTWKIGDECFILDVRLDGPLPQVRIMPARVTSIGGSARGQKTVSATSVDAPKHLGRFGTVQGRPFETEAAARLQLRDMQREVDTAITRAEVIGKRPEPVELHRPVPTIGDIIYVVDEERTQLLEVHVGIVQEKDGWIEVGYDPTFGPQSNPEVSMVAAPRYWTDKAAAMAEYRRTWGHDPVFIPREKVAEWADAEIEGIWNRAAGRVAQS